MRLAVKGAIAFAGALAAIVLILSLSLRDDPTRTPPRRHETETTNGDDGSSPSSSGEEGTADPARPRAAEASNCATILGTVTGRYGGIWGIRMTVYQAGSGRVLATAESDRQGNYRLEFQGPARVDLEALPGAETGLGRVVQSDVFLGIGETRQLDVPLESGTRLRGRLVALAMPPTDVAALPEDASDEFRRAYERAALERFQRSYLSPIRIVALPLDRLPHDGAYGDLLLSLLQDVPRESTRSAEDGAFDLRGLKPGRHRLFLDSAQWMFRDPVIVADDVENARYPIIPALTLLIIVEDFVTLRRIDGASATFLQEGRSITSELHGVEGRIGCRIPLPVEVEDRSDLELRVQAPGYVEERLDLPLPSGWRVQLLPATPPNLSLSVLYDDGTPYDGALEANLGREDEPALKTPAMIDEGGGRYQIAVPPGELLLRLAVPETPFAVEALFALDFAPGATGTRTLHVRRFGSLRVSAAQECDIYIERLEEAGNPARGRLEPLARTWGGDSSAASFPRMPPGRYRLHARGPDHEPFRQEFEVQPGAETAVAVPTLELRIVLQD